MKDLFEIQAKVRYDHTSRQHRRGVLLAARGVAIMQADAVAREVRPSRILYVSGPPLVPSKLGPARRNHHIVGQLARHYDVSVVAIGHREHAATFHSTCRAPVRDATFVPAHFSSRTKFVRKLFRTIRGQSDFLPAYDPALRRACLELTARNAFDAIVLSSLLLRRLPFVPGVPVIADTHNVEFDVHGRTAATAENPFRRVYAARQAACTREEERRCGARVNLLLATSERDGRLFASELRIRPVEVIPNGIDLLEFQPQPKRSSSPTILFSGLMSYYPNQQGIRWFLDHVFPTVRRFVPGATLVIAGASPPPWFTARADGHVTVTGRVPDMRPYLADASVVIAPLMIGGGTRVKILEAHAMLRPIVSTTLGAEGLGERHGETILLADDAVSFAESVTRLLQERHSAARLAAAGRQHVIAHFNWDAIGDKLAQVLDARVGLTRRVEHSCIPIAATT